MSDKIRDNAFPISHTAEVLGKDLEHYGIGKRDVVLANIKNLRHLLTKVTQEIERRDLLADRRAPDTSSMMPCLLCNDHYPVAGEYVRGIRYEPVPGLSGWVYICWECVCALDKVIHNQLSGLAYTFLFTRKKPEEKIEQAQ